MKWVRRAAAALALAAAVAGGAGYLWLRSSLPQVGGQIRAPGLDAPAEIVRDRNGAAHIRAETEAGAYYALGFVHAQDRLFQMEFMRRLGRGRLSEVAGRAALPTDRMMRTLGISRLADASYALLSAPARAAVDAYSAGVNGYLATRTGALPPEFQLLRFAPEPWDPRDSLLWGRMMAMRLSGNWRDEALRASLAARLPPARLDQLWPAGRGEAPPTTLAGAAPPRTFAGLLRHWPQEMSPLTASNSWGLDGSRTPSGKPLLANDTHLGYRAPGVWYLARLEAPGLTLAGATAPGVPFTILGHNGRIAWAMTTTGSDTQDLFVERVDPRDAGRYLTPDGSRPFVLRRETIRVRGGADEAFEVRETRHGPVISDAIPSLAGPGAAASRPVALAATALRADDRTAEAIYRLNRARDWAGFRDALRLLHAPQQNVTYADVEGNLGFLAPARVPIRRRGSGRSPAPGWTGDHDWIGFVPFEHLPRLYNPRSGRIVNANHRVVSDAYPYFLGEGDAPGYRARRIHQLLDAPAAHGVGAARAAQLDRVSLMARALLPLMRGVDAGPAPRRALLAALGRWDGEMARERPEPLIFVAWLRALNRALFADELGDRFDDYWGLRPVAVHRALTENRVWCDDAATGAVETCEERIALALDEAIDELAGRFGDDWRRWRWGAAHEARFAHPLFGRIPLLRRLADIRIASDGGGYTVNRGRSRIADADAPYAAIHGPVYRAIYDLADLDRSLFMLPTGQSGNPLSRRYRDLTRRWRDGEYLRLPAAPRDPIGVLRLVPARADGAP